MKTKLIALAVLFFTNMSGIFACDICGCGVGSYYLGILPEFKKKFIGLRYQHKLLRTHIGPDGEFTYLTNKETYQTIELWGAVNIGKKFRVIGFVPVNHIQREGNGKSYHSTGLGDIAAVGFYQVADKRTTTTNGKFLGHSLWVGAGIKVPTGKYNNNETNISSGDQNTFQLGTGSFDFTLNAMYDLRLQDFGINTNISYKINTANKYDYTYGNKFTGNFLFYCKFRINDAITISPNAGGLYEISAQDWQHSKSKVSASGGDSFVATIGTEINFNRFGIGGNYQAPIYQNLASGRVKGYSRFMLNLNIAL